MKTRTRNCIVEVYQARSGSLWVGGRGVEDSLPKVRVTLFLPVASFLSELSLDNQLPNSDMETYYKL